MKTYIIRIKNNKNSEQGAQGVLVSSNILGMNYPVEMFDAITPETKDETLTKYNIKWNYPWNKEELDKELKILKVPYKTSNKDTKIACALSHYSLWKKCEEINEPILILEHDVLWTKKLDTSALMKSEKQIIGINDPKGATPKAGEYTRSIQTSKDTVQSVPRVFSDKRIPSGLAGGSAYLMKPDGAKMVLESVDKYGLWHNDAFLCYQLFDEILGVSKTFYTKRNVRIKSTTT